MGSEITLTNDLTPAQAFEILKSANFKTMYPMGSQWSLKDLSHYSSKQQMIAIKLSDEFVGFVCFLPIDTLTIEILMVVLDPIYWGQGHMKEALLQILHKYKEVWLEVHEENLPAKQLYLSLGFEITGKRLNYYKNDGAALLMRYKKS